MREIFNFIINHYEAILSVLTFIISVIILCLRKKPVSGIESIIYQFVGLAIRSAELNPELKGIDKLNFAVNYINQRLEFLYPDLNVDLYRPFIVSVIEDYLTTPQKKEVK